MYFMEYGWSHTSINACSLRWFPAHVLAETRDSLVGADSDGDVSGCSRRDGLPSDETVPSSVFIHGIQVV